MIYLIIIKGGAARSPLIAVNLFRACDRVWPCCSRRTTIREKYFEWRHDRDANF